MDAENTADPVTSPVGQPSKMTKVLPTNRISHTKQMAILRAWGAAYAAAGQAVTPNDVASLVDLHPDTVRLTNTFFMDVGLIERQAKGSFIPNADVIAFNLAYQWDAETAATKLYPAFNRTWFARPVTTTLGFRVTLEQKDVIALIASAAGASREHEDGLELLLDYLVVSGVVEREGTSIRLPRHKPIDVPETTVTKDAPSGEKRVSDERGQAVRVVKLPRAGGSITLSGNINLFALSGDERTLVFDLIDLMEKFEHSAAGSTVKRGIKLGEEDTL